MDLICTPRQSSPSNSGSLGTSARVTAFNFLKLPPEVRNMVYTLLLVTPEPIWIRSPRKKHQRKKRFGSMLEVNKQINAEAKTILWGNNKIAIGNGSWGSTKDSNMHALQHFLARVPKDCISLIRAVEVEIHCYGWRVIGTHFTNDGPIQIQRALSKHFIGVEFLTISTMHSSYGWRKFEYSRHGLFKPSRQCARCQSPRKALRLLFSLPGLNTRSFKFDGNEELADLLEVVWGLRPEIIQRVKYSGIKGLRFVMVKESEITPVQVISTSTITQ